MIVGHDGTMSGSVSGGCVEGAVVKEAMKLNIAGGGKPLAYGVTDDDAWSVGLSCGGRIQVYAERFIAFDTREEEQAVWAALRTCLATNSPCILITSLVEGENKHTLLDPAAVLIGHTIPDAVRDEALSTYRKRKHCVVEHESTSYFIQVFPRRSHMLVIGAAHVTTHLVDLAAMYDFETTVIDPRGAFATGTHFNNAPDRIVESYPSEVLEEIELDPYTYAVILSHDPKIDDNALHVLLKSDVAYIGALGSKKTHAKRVVRLLSAGFSEEEVDKIHAPIGSPINALRPKEIALSIIAEIISVKNAHGR